MGELISLDAYRRRQSTEIIIERPQPELTDQEKRELAEKLLRYGEWDDSVQGLVIKGEENERD